MGIQVQKGDTLWGIAKQSVQAQNGEGQKVTNQQIVDAMNQIAKDNGYESIDDCVKDNFYAKNGELGTLKVKGLEIEHADEGAEGVAEDIPEAGTEELPNEDGTVDEQQVLEYTTLGAGGTFAAKTTLKIGNDILKNPKVKKGTKKVATTVADVTKKGVTKLKARVDAAKVKHAQKVKVAKRKAAMDAGKEAKAAKNTLEAEKAKLKEMRANKASKKDIAAQKKVVEKAKSNSTKATQKMKTKRKAAGLNQTTGAPLKNKKIVKTPKGKVAKASAKKAAKTAAKTGGKKAAAKAAAKAGGKTLLKKIPGVGLLAGIAFAADRAMHGDWTGAAGEVLSGAASCLPGVGTGVSVAIDAGLMYRDIKNS